MAATNRARVVRTDTREAITTALLQLLAKENLVALTVSRVCQRAGVSRMAFYRNFDGLQQVLYEHFQPKFAAVFQVIRRSGEFSVKLERQLEFFAMVGDDMVASVNRGYEPILQKIFRDETALIGIA